jgi:peptidyl-dipeptidase A
MNMLPRPHVAAVATLLALCACQPSTPDTGAAAAAAAQKNATAAPAKPTAEEARAFIADVEAKADAMNTENSRLAWVQATYIMPDTEALLAKASERANAQQLEWARQAARFDGLELDYDTARKLRFLKQGFVLPPPSDPAKNAELAQLTTAIAADYSKYKYHRGDKDLSFEDMAAIMADSRDPKELLEIWTAWRDVAPPLRDRYTRIIELANDGAHELGFKDAGELWRIGYDMPPEEFTADLDRLLGQVKPLYQSLHCYVRAKLNQYYGDAVVPPTGPIPAQMLGNMWAQSWGNVYPLMGIKESKQGYDLTQIIEKRKMTEQDMVRTAEQFFVSLGFEHLPQTFWERSLFVRPADRDVDCYASAWHIDTRSDVRLKMCIQRTADDFRVLHHELGHNYYQLAYRNQDFMYRTGANDGFHEAVGDTLALSVGPTYLKQIGFIDQVPASDSDIPQLLQSALDRVAILPWTYLIDQWRWRVFSGDIKPDQYNTAWWELRERYQGVAPPTARGEEYFDPGAKFHVPNFVPYTRYFLAAVLQFQFHRALCEAAGYTGPLNRCSIYDNKEAGKRLGEMLAMGASRPWQDALEKITGSREMDASAILDFYAPLQTWLDEQNQGRQCGW